MDQRAGHEHQPHKDGVDAHKVDVIARSWKEAIALRERGEIRLAIAALIPTLAEYDSRGLPDAERV